MQNSPKIDETQLHKGSRPQNEESLYRSAFRFATSNGDSLQSKNQFIIAFTAAIGFPPLDFDILKYKKDMTVEEFSNLIHNYSKSAPMHREWFTELDSRCKGYLSYSDMVEKREALSGGSLSERANDATRLAFVNTLGSRVMYKDFANILTCDQDAN